MCYVRSRHGSLLRARESPQSGGRSMGPEMIGFVMNRGDTQSPIGAPKFRTAKNQQLPGRPVAHGLGLLFPNSSPFWGLVAYDLASLGFPDRFARTSEVDYHSSEPAQGCLIFGTCLKTVYPRLLGERKVQQAARQQKHVAGGATAVCEHYMA